MRATLFRLDADPKYPDSCFVEDTAIIIPEFAFQCARVPSPTRVVTTRPGAGSRTGEVEGMRAALEQIVPEFAIQQIQAPGTLDGGDICEAGEHYFIGLSERTNETGAEQLAQFVTAHGYTAGFVDIRARPRLEADHPAAAFEKWAGVSWRQPSGGNGCACRA